jgi:hypothetical protein
MSRFTRSRPRYHARPKPDPEARALEREGRAMYRAGRRMPTNPHKRSGYCAERNAHAHITARIGG